MESKMTEYIKQLKLLCDETQRQWEITDGADEIEDCLLKILNFIKNHPAYYTEAKKFLIERIHRNERFPIEIICFTMRELQWPEIKATAIEEQTKTDDWRIISAMNDILAVYEKHWENAEFYRYYSKSK